ncbi:MAG: bifunctional 5,10-methylenetetrahydrofolate dehydrogenase/5,10-methenyltetrahydrofolate cyclohydrolase [Vicinamibacterales bacterium]
MAARLLEGAAVARTLKEELVPKVARFRQTVGRPPGLGIVLVGDDPASHTYVTSKVKSGSETGLWVDFRLLPGSTSIDEVLRIVDEMNRSDRHDGILVQAPLPAAMGGGAARRIFDALDPAKDVDGFTAENVGRLSQNRPGLVACTPAGVMLLLERSGIRVAGAHAVVVGRSDIVGKPMAMLLLHRDATVTICHSKTPDLRAVCAGADILVAAIGRPAFVTADYVKPGATVVDVGINHVTDEREAARIWGVDSARYAKFREKGTLLVGDVHPGVAEVAGALTPVPGGVGPLTIAMLLAGTLTAAERRAGVTV